MFRIRKHKKDLELNVTDGKDIVYDEEIPIQDIDTSEHNEISSPKNNNDSNLNTYNSENSDAFSDDVEPELQQLSSNNNKRNNNSSRFLSPSPIIGKNKKTGSAAPSISSAAKPGPSKENNSSTIENRPKSGTGNRGKPMLRTPSDSESDSDDGLMIMEHAKGPLPGEYDPEKYNNLDVTEEIKDLFQYITKYTPQHLNLDYKFKPFVPEYIPAVGDIDAFLKIVPPERMLSTNESTNFTDLGLTVLDEPAATQSDSALLHLQLRAVSVTTNKDNKNMIIKKIENVDKNSKTIDKWIVDISDLHRAKPPPMVKFTNPMPDIDNLMQEWPQAVELLLRKDGFPSHSLKCTTAEYIDMVCALFGIPVYEKKIQSLHLLFSLYVAIKNSQLYRVGNERDVDESEDILDQQSTEQGTTDQLILD